MFCPKCGTKNKSNSHFCKNCGFDLAKYRQKAKVDQTKTHQPKADQAQTNPKHRTLHQSTPRFNRRPMPQRPVRPMMPPKHHHTGLKISLSIIIIFAILVFGGVYTYSHNMFPFGSGPLSSVSQSPNGTKTIKDVWQKVNNKLDSSASNGGSDDYTSDFANGTSNSAYHTINGWSNLENKADSNNDTKVVSIKPYDFQNHGNGKYAYKVRYNFEIDAGSSNSYHHIQVFNWKTTVKNGKITSMNSPKTPSENYHE